MSLPKQLPSPLKTLQKACTEKVFAENPANCPKASNVGEARVTTPVLEGGLSGPAYFVSHGGAKYPELDYRSHRRGRRDGAGAWGNADQ